MLREMMPRLFQLRDLIENPSAPGAYFRDFELELRTKLTREIFLARERELNLLDAVSWEALKNEARPYLTRRDPGGRGWSQLIDILNQARAHNYLVGRGCSGVAFVPRGENPTPDLEAILNHQKLLCEVKTINISDKEVERQNTQNAGRPVITLPNEFLTKLTRTLHQARGQMFAYNDSAACVTLVIINFDDLFTEYKVDYYAQIDQHLASESVGGTEIVIYNQRTLFHSHITMQNAFVVNEAEWPAPDPL